MTPPYKWNNYTSYNDVWKEIKDADVIMFSSYAWNYGICDDIAKIAKQNNKITILGGPHIGTNEPDFLESRNYYDFICQPTKPGETFIEDFINLWFEDNLNPELISWELRSTVIGKVFDIGNQDYSVYEDHKTYLKETHDYAVDNDLEYLIILETTRGCPYQCVFCEWGGGIGTKLYKKNIEIVKKDITTLKEVGFFEAYVADGNFGAFFDRDLEIYKFAWNNDFYLTDISQVKLTDYNKRKKMIDTWFDVVAGNIKKQKEYVSMGTEKDKDMFHGSSKSNVVPAVALQTLSDEAMKVCKRVDLSANDKIRLTKHIHKRCNEEGLEPPGLEMILGMPGSTIDDFYNEMQIFHDLRTYSTWRYDYMFLPDSDLNSEEYKKEYKIETVETFFDINDDDGNDFEESLYKNKKTSFKTIISCYSYTREEYLEMWFMNSAGTHLLKEYYKDFENFMGASEFCKRSFQILKNCAGFDTIWNEIKDILDPTTPPKSIKQINGEFRVDVISRFIDENVLILKAQLMEEVLIAS